MTSFFSWNDSYDLGIDAMNSEHKTLIAMMNRLYEKHEQGAEFDSLKQSVEDLANYTIKHFSDEETYMESINYPELKVHKLIHADLLKKLAKHKEDFLASQTLSPMFFNFLKMWLSAHIQGIDMKYSNFKKENVA
ncbi:bacteriohemerythrin [Pseudobacteriovorax antillogorgiicola]|uniref:Hemerythrin n=1 Tax=Pseudobacteriovorax antillogorgiicola TaxID=1513793 RepID=A0A1Y6BSB4_9BACT|nr:hemerythrin family protein [Pseudobacteriovorax antillogorgiicola]TCS53114.1 hemerythrin [Pseudobacteriovorax antillogorgiicola]SMF25543.1 hemerythrin [Pseudobacteriovorax antillogorgiicola]